MIISKDRKGLLIINKEYKKIIPSGRYLKLPFTKIEEHSIFEEFSPKKQSLEIILNDKEMSTNFEVIEIKDNQIALHFENGIYKNIIRTGKHAYWKSIIDHKFIMVDLDDPVIDKNIDRLILMKPEFKELICSYGIEAYQKGILFIDNKFSQILEPGNYFYWKGSKSISVIKVDLRQQQMEITGQDIMTKDKIPLRLNFFCQYKINNVITCIVEINEYEKQFYVLLQLSLREYIGSMLLDEILAKKEEIGLFIGNKIKEKANSFGIDVLNIGIKDIILPGDIKDIINQVLIAEKKSQANVIMRREETASTRSLLNTAKLLEENKILYHLKELEYIERISEKISQISLNGGGIHLLEELKKIFIPDSK